MPTKLLEKALAEIAKLPNEEQEAIGAWLLEELAAERAWEKLLRRSPDALAQLAEEALAEHRAKNTETLDPNTL